MQSLCNMIMQSLCNKVMQESCWHITSCWTTVAADEFLGPTPPPLRPVVVVGTPNSTVTFGIISAFAGPVLFEPDPGLGLTVSMQSLHKFALHNVSQRDGVAASHPNKNLVELAMCQDYWSTCNGSSSATQFLDSQAEMMLMHYANSLCKSIPVRCAAHCLILPLKCGFFLCMNLENFVLSHRGCARGSENVFFFSCSSPAGGWAFFFLVFFGGSSSARIRGWLTCSSMAAHNSHGGLQRRVRPTNWNNPASMVSYVCS